MKILKQIKPSFLIASGVIILLIIIGLVWSFGGDKPRNLIPANISIGSNGDVRISGVYLQSSSWGSITAIGKIKDETIKIVIDTDDKTIIRKGASIIKVGDLEKWDNLNVSGVLKEFDSSLEILAKNIQAYATIPQKYPTSTTTRPYPTSTTTSTIKAVKVGTTTPVLKPVAPVKK